MSAEHKAVLVLHRHGQMTASALVVETHFELSVTQYRYGVLFPLIDAELVVARKHHYYECTASGHALAEELGKKRPCVPLNLPPCAPRKPLGLAQRAPQPLREGADEATRWPSLIGQWRVWPDGKTHEIGATA